MSLDTPKDTLTKNIKYDHVDHSSMQASKILFNITRIARGYFEGNELIYYLVTQAILCVILLSLTYGVYEINYYYSGTPGVVRYSIFTCTMSELGAFDKYRNPKGWYIFSINMIVYGLMDLPNIQFICRRMIKINKICTYIGATGIIGTGLLDVAIGCVPWDLKPYHTIIASTSFGFYGFGMIAFGILVLKQLRVQNMLCFKKSTAKYQDKIEIGEQEGIFIQKYLLYPFCVLLFEWVFAAICCFIWWIQEWIDPSIGDLGPGICSEPFWEWVTLWTCILCLIWFGIAVGRPTNRWGESVSDVRDEVL